MKKLIRAVMCAVALLWLSCLVDGCGSESEGVVVERPPEGGSEFDAGPVLIAGVVGGHSRFGPHFANVLVWSDGMAMIGPLKEGRWRWTKLREERVSEILSALEREGVAKSRHPDMVKSFSPYLIVACRCKGGSGVAWAEWEDSSNGSSRLPSADSERVLNARAIEDALGPVFDLVNSIKEPRADCPLFEGEVFRKRTLADYSNLWALNENLHLDG